MSQAVFATSRAIDKNTMAEFRRFSSYYFPYINKLQYKLKHSLMFDSSELKKSSVNMNDCASVLHMYSLNKCLIINEFSKIWTYTNKKCIKKAINNHMRAKRRKMCSMPGSLRKAFRESKIAKAAAMTLVAGGTFASAVTGAATDAVAGDGKIAFHKFSAEDTADYIELSGASASKNRLSITVYSTNDEMLRAAYQEAQRIENTTDFDVYFLQAPREGPITKVVIYANGLRIAEIRNGGNTETFTADLGRGFELGQKRLASVPAGDGPLVALVE